MLHSLSLRNKLVLDIHCLQGFKVFDKTESK